MLAGQELQRHNRLNPIPSTNRPVERDLSLDKEFDDFVMQASLESRELLTPAPSGGASSIVPPPTHGDFVAVHTGSADEALFLQRRVFRRSGAAYSSKSENSITTFERYAVAKELAPVEPKGELGHFSLPRLELEPPTPPASPYQSKVIQVLLDPSYSKAEPALNSTGEGGNEPPLTLELDEDPFPYERFLSTQPLGVTATEALSRASLTELECHAVTTNETVHLCSMASRTSQTGPENDLGIQQNIPAVAPACKWLAKGETSGNSHLNSWVAHTGTFSIGTTRVFEEQPLPDTKSKGFFTALRLRSNVPSTLREHTNSASIGDCNRSLGLHLQKAKAKRAIPSVTDIFKNKTVREGAVLLPHVFEQAQEKLKAVPQTVSKVSPKSTDLLASSAPEMMESKTAVDGVSQPIHAFKVQGLPQLSKVLGAADVHKHNSPQANTRNLSSCKVSLTAQNTRSKALSGNKPLPPLPSASGNLDPSTSSSFELCNDYSSYKTPAFSIAPATSSGLLNTLPLPTLPSSQSENGHLFHSPGPVKAYPACAPLASVEQKYTQKPLYPGLTVRVKDTQQCCFEEARLISGNHTQSVEKPLAPNATKNLAQASVKIRTGMGKLVCGTETGFPAAWAFNGATLGRMHSRPSVDAELLAGEVPPHAQRFAHPIVLQAQPPINAHDAELHRQMAFDQEDPFHGLAVQRYRHRCVTQHKGLCTSITCACGCHMCQLWRAGESEVKLNKDGCDRGQRERTKHET